MPYISQEYRGFYRDRCKYLGQTAKSAGELNYIFSMIAREYLLTEGENYAIMNNIIGALEGAKIEFYRKHMADYEEAKIKIHGDLDE